MRRRDLLAGAALAAARPLTAADSLLKPKALRPGDTVGLITPATYVSDPDRIATAERTVRYFGLEPKFAKNVRKRAGYLGGSVEERVADLHEMFSDSSVQGIFCMRGGYGAGQLLDHIDYDLIRRNPKVFLGYSDITSLLVAIQKRTGMVTFHGPVMGSAFTSFTQANFRKALFDPKPIGVLTNPPESNQLRPAHTLRAIRGGKARGPLIGGNLTLISATMGTPFEIETRGRILFFEDVGEEPYRIDRMLTQLRLAGKLQAAAGIIWGECSECTPREYKPGFESTFSTGEVVDGLLGDLGIPVLAGLTIGHTDDQLTLPEGVRAELDAGKGELTIVESATV